MTEQLRLPALDVRATHTAIAGTVKHEDSQPARIFGEDEAVVLLVTGTRGDLVVQSTEGGRVVVQKISVSEVYEVDQSMATDLLDQHKQMLQEQLDRRHGRARLGRVS